jgi:DNA-binding CsgD family transcriptional regulator
MNRPITDEERVAVLEHYYRRCYITAVAAVVAVCVVCAVVSLLDRGRLVPLTIGACAAVALVTACFARQSAYRLLRHAPYLVAVPAVALIGPVHWWPAIDLNLVSFAVIAPIALAVCAAQRARDVYWSLALIAVARAAATALDPQAGAHGNAVSFASVVVTAVLSVALLSFTVHWSGLVVLSEASGPDDEGGGPLLLEAGSPAVLPVGRGRLSRTPLTVLAVDAAHELAGWMRAIRELIVSSSARRQAWYRATGFHARELQVLLLLSEHREVEVASSLGISVKTVRNTAVRALARERRDLDEEASSEVTRRQVAIELAATYPTAGAIESLAAEVETS